MLLNSMALVNMVIGILGRGTILESSSSSRIHNEAVYQSPQLSKNACAGIRRRCVTLDMRSRGYKWDWHGPRWVSVEDI